MTMKHGLAVVSWIGDGPTHEEQEVARHVNDMSKIAPFTLSVEDMRRAHFYAQQLRVIQDALASNVISPKTYELARKTEARLREWFFEAHLVIEAANKMVKDWPARPVDEYTAEAAELDRWRKSLEGEFWNIVFYDPQLVSREEKIRMARVSLYLNGYSPEYPDDDALAAHADKFATRYHPGFSDRVRYYEERVAKHRERAR